MKRSITFLLTAFFLAAAIPDAAVAGPAQNAIIKHYQELAGGAAASGFSAKAGAAFFAAKHQGGKPATPSCSTCHTSSPLNTGHTRASKPISPMALSRTPDRFSDLKKVEKWFGRNCRSVLGRECTPVEKGNFLAYMISQ